MCAVKAGLVMKSCFAAALRLPLAAMASSSRMASVLMSLFLSEPECCLLDYRIKERKGDGSFLLGLSVFHAWCQKNRHEATRTRGLSGLPADSRVCCELRMFSSGEGEP